MKYLILILLLSLSNLNAENMGKQLVGQNCLNLALIDSVLEEARDNNIDKNEMITKILQDKKFNEETKGFILNEITLIYNLPKKSKYSSAITKQCLNKGYITIIQT